MKLNKHPKTTK